MADDQPTAEALRAVALQPLIEICASVPERIIVCRPRLPKAEKIAKYLAEADAGRRYSNHGGLVLALERRLRETTGRRAHVVTAASGTAAIVGAILASAGRARPSRSLCLVPAYTFIGTVSAIEQCGYTPHFVDVDPVTWMMEPRHCFEHELIEKVGLVLPVAPYGRPVPQARWANLSRDTGIPVVIDGAAAFDGLIAAPDDHLGPVPVAVSFHATKSFCTGEGGGVFCSDENLSRATMRCLNFGYDADRVCSAPCINGKMSEYHAAVGLAELDGWHEKRAAYRLVVERYRSRAAAVVDRLWLAPSIAASYAIYDASSVEEARCVADALAEAGIGHRKWYGPGAHRQPYCSRFGCDEVPTSDDLASRLIGLPMSVDLADEDVDAIVETIDAGAGASVASKSSFPASRRW